MRRSRRLWLFFFISLTRRVVWRHFRVRVDIVNDVTPMTAVKTTQAQVANSFDLFRFEPHATHSLLSTHYDQAAIMRLAYDHLKMSLIKSSGHSLYTRRAKTIRVSSIFVVIDFAGTWSLPTNFDRYHMPVMRPIKLRSDGSISSVDNIGTSNWSFTLASLPCFVTDRLYSNCTVTYSYTYLVCSCDEL